MKERKKTICFFYMNPFPIFIILVLFPLLSTSTPDSDNDRRVLDSFRLRFDKSGAVSHVNGVSADEHKKNLDRMAQESPVDFHAHMKDKLKNRRASKQISERVPNDLGYPTIYDGVNSSHASTYQGVGNENTGNVGSSFRYEACVNGIGGPFDNMACSGTEWTDSDTYKILDTNFVNYTCQEPEGIIQMTEDIDSGPPTLNANLLPLRLLGLYNLRSDTTIGYNVVAQNINDTCYSRWRGHPLLTSQDTFFYGRVGLSFTTWTSAPKPSINQYPIFRTYADFEPAFYGNQSFIRWREGGTIDVYERFSLGRPECGAVEGEIFIANRYDNDTEQYCKDVILQVEWWPDFYCCSGNDTMEVNDSATEGSICCAGESFWTEYECIPYYGSDGDVNATDGLDSSGAAEIAPLTLEDSAIGLFAYSMFCIVYENIYIYIT